MNLSNNISGSALLDSHTTRFDVNEVTVDTLEYVGQVYTNNLNSNNYIDDDWLYMTVNTNVVRVKLQPMQAGNSFSNSQFDT